MIDRADRDDAPCRHDADAAPVQGAATDRAAQSPGQSPAQSPVQLPGQSPGQLPAQGPPSPARAALCSLWDRPYLLLVIAMTLWSGNYVSARFVLDDFAPAAFAQARWTLALLILLPFTWPYVRRDLPVLRAHAGLIALLGGIGIGLYNTLIYLGLQQTTVVNASLLASMFPVTVALTGFVLYRDRLTLPQAAGIALASLGAVVVLTGGDVSAIAHVELNRGDLFMLVSQFLWALYTVLLRRRPPLHPLSFLTATVAVGQLALIPYTAYEVWRGAPVRIDAEVVAAVVYVTLFASLIAFVAFNRAVDLIGSNRSGPFFHLIPVFGALLAVLLLGERIMPFHLVGWVLIVAGIAAAQIGTRRDIDGAAQRGH